MESAFSRPGHLVLEDPLLASRCRNVALFGLFYLWLVSACHFICPLHIHTITSKNTRVIFLFPSLEMFSLCSYVFQTLNLFQGSIISCCILLAYTYTMCLVHSEICFERNLWCSLPRWLIPHSPCPHGEQQDLCFPAH